MTRYRIDEVIAEVRLALGCNAEDHPLISIHDEMAHALNRQITTHIATAARQVMENAPDVELGTGIPLHCRLNWPEAEGRGMAVMPLPDDCMRLMGVQLSDWRCQARIITAGDPEYQWQRSGFTGIGGNPDRPIAAIVQQPAGMVAELYASTAGPGVRVIMAHYMPIPAIVDGAIRLPRRLYHDIIRRTALLTANTLEGVLIPELDNLSTTKNRQ